ncbi:hypothetical protein K461DRAFT_276232 [Myriangium duriaei CBS 260.36]|uniref:Protein Zds1 C-terminal domain-containing protein n=1 Tax=Myriangium duriaei CBS 260.36 TaxID=1168546 RepID=A0A9P4JA22_9PEZI|nr:hypothetical protein K461DRAFT_276232 [Myriangium duriaei CBS 260.36]
MAERQSSKRGHTPQISISDTNHHVTEAIGGMYGSDDEDYPHHSPQNNRNRPLSFMPAPREGYDSGHYNSKHTEASRNPHPLAVMQDRITVRGDSNKPSNDPPRRPSLTQQGEGPTSPPALRRSSSQDTAVQQFPLNDIDYESSPAAVAQELSNLQAIRRMSMNVDAADPDLPSFGSGFGIPALPPSDADEDDASRLFWVPARLHPELAPREFKTFIEDRVEKMKRLSGDAESLSVDGLERKISSGLKRKKSMLSRQIENEKGYEDGATRLERKRSESGHAGAQPTNLSELEELVNDPTTLIRKMSIDTVRKSQDSAIGVPQGEDMPMLPGVGAGLKRSTRTAYRRGSLRKGERAPASKRAIGRSVDAESESPSQSPILGPDEPIPGITRVRTEPIASSSGFNDQAENFSRPGRKARPGFGPTTAVDDSSINLRKSPSPEEQQQTRPESQPTQFHSRIASGGWTTAQLPGQNAPVPHIIETPPPPDPPAHGHLFPERKSSMQQAPIPHHPNRPGPLIQGARSRHSLPEKHDSPATLDDISSHPSPIPGGGASRTDDLTMVPTFDAKKAEAKSGRKTSWGWLLGSEEKDREKAEKESQKERERERERDKELQRQREREEKEKEKLRKPKVSSKLANQDKARLDVLQTSIDSASPRGRESLVLNREDIKLEEERRKESSRKSKGEDGKKEKDSLLSAIFGGGKRSKSSEENSKKRNSNRSLSPEPPPRILKPDIDYNWTRFSILEERAIYRMAHIKLANPKRALYSQVLLSNFMYSYLAKVQMMHPQMQVGGGGGGGPQQKQQQKSQQQQQRKEERQADEFVQYQRWQEQQARLEGAQDQHQAAETGSVSGRRAHDDNGYGSQGYGNYGYDVNGGGQHGQAYEESGSSADGGAHGYGTDYLGYGKQSGQQHFDHEDDDEDRWDGAEGNMFEGLS